MAGLRYIDESQMQHERKELKKTYPFQEQKAQLRCAAAYTSAKYIQTRNKIKILRHSNFDSNYILSRKHKPEGFIF